MNDTRSAIEFTYKGTKYKLEFTASSIKQMERNGFKFGKMDEMVLTAPLELFSGAFIANHRNTPRKLRDEIFYQLNATAEADGEDGGEELVEVLGNMLAEAIEELNSHQGNVKWSVVK